MNTVSLQPAGQPVNARPGLRAPGGARRFKPKSKFGPIGLAVMVGAHVLIGYALATGLARQVFEVVKKPLTATIIEEVKLPPPPPPPPPRIQKIAQAPKPNTPPPPAYVPPPEVQPPAAPPAPSIQAVQTVKAEAPPPAVAPAPAAPPAPPASVHSDISLACPKQVKPEMPQKAVDDGIEGTVKAEVHVRNGKVMDVRILSGPRIYYAAVRAAMLRYECVNGDAEVIATQDFTFKVD